MLNITGTYTDQYQLTMGQVYFLRGQKDHSAIFDYSFRKLPFEGGYAVFAGVETILELVENLTFSTKDINYLHHKGFHSDYLEYLKTFRFTGTIRSCHEGEIIFPISPILTVEAPVIEAQIIETLLLNSLNFQTLIATKASRIRSVAGHCQLIDFGLRRAQGMGGYHASRAAIIGGMDATSHVQAGRDFNLPTSGTMAHSFVQSYEDELLAFRDFAQVWPENCVLLVDTYNTLESGVPNAIAVGKEMAARGQQLKGIRLDSGDLAYLSKKSRQMLDEAGLREVKISVSNQLDEMVIKSLLDQGAPIDIFGVGTKLVVGHPDAALDGVYKLASINGKPRIKLSENIGKMTLPDKKQVYRILEDGSFFGADMIVLEEENPQTLSDLHHPVETGKFISVGNLQKEALLHAVFDNGRRLGVQRSISEIKEYSQKRLAQLPSEYKRFDNPHLYKVGLSKRLLEERNVLKEKYLQSYSETAKTSGCNGSSTHPKKR